MSSVNKMILVGNLGQDPEVKYMPSGGAVCTLSVATTRSWKNKESGERQDETEWHRVVLYERMAEIAGEYLKKGRPVYIEGRLKTRKWTDKDGIERYTTEIVGVEMQLIGGRDQGEGDGDGGRQGASRGRDAGGGQQRQQPAQQQSRGTAGGGGGNGYGGGAQSRQAPQGGRSSASGRVPAAAGGFDDMDDDIPF